MQPTSFRLWCCFISDLPATTCLPFLPWWVCTYGHTSTCLATYLVGAATTLTFGPCIGEHLHSDMLATPEDPVSPHPALPVHPPPRRGDGTSTQSPQLAGCSSPGVQPSIRWALSACPIVLGWVAPFPHGEGGLTAPTRLAGPPSVTALWTRMITPASSNITCRHLQL